MTARMGIVSAVAHGLLVASLAGCGSEPPSTSTTILTMPSLAGAQSIRIQDNWSGLSEVAPVFAVAVLRRTGERFVGDVEYRAGGLSGEELTVTRTLSIPIEPVQRFLDTLSKVTIVNELYEIPPTATDYYPERKINVTLETWSVEFYSDSQNEDASPWRFSTSSPDGFCAKDCVVETGEPFTAIGLLNNFLERTAQEELFRLIEDRTP